MESTPRPWADTPFALIDLYSGPVPSKDGHYCYSLATEMTHVHNLILRPLNAIYNQAPYIPKDSLETVKSFLFYCENWHGCINHHHHGEEEHFFPRLEQAAGVHGLLEPNVEQHAAFHDGLEAFGKYSKETRPEDFDGMALRKIIDSFGQVLRDHLMDEIDTLLRLKSYDSEKLKGAWAEGLKFVCI